MERVSIDEVGPPPYDDCRSDRRALADPLGTSDVAITRNVLEPGERLSGSVHTHIDPIIDMYSRNHSIVATIE
ncbi:hypothetical protein HALLA_05370 [Halostagnicola larsenii XH-48]|uniref:Uncharacterized protein n=1 Tax=Halostagnicola larsenii XH-48 TaxID=797299 RepID=W0JUI5_9EURY|nr:hypothetical protein HALLA_05370 [Halostagnicola larsenii XH-48]